MLRLLLALALLPHPAWASGRRAAPAPPAQPGRLAPLTMGMNAPAPLARGGEVSGSLPEAVVVPGAAALPAAAKPEPLRPLRGLVQTEERLKESLLSPQGGEAGQGFFGQEKADGDALFDKSKPQGPDEPQPFFVRNYWLLSPLRPLVRAVLRPKIYGAENIPKAPAVVVLPHVSFGPDVLLTSLGLGRNRPIRYLFNRRIMEAAPIKEKLRSGRVRPIQKPVLRALAYLMPVFFGMAGTIGVMPKEPREVLEKSLETARGSIRAGVDVGVFAEGSITGTGLLGQLYDGFARIVRGVPGTKVLPAHLDGLWGHFMSRRGLPKGSYLKDLMVRPSVRFGKPLENADPHLARQAISALAVEAMTRRLRDNRGTLSIELLRRAKRRWNQKAVADKSQEMTYGRLVTEAAVIAESMRSLRGENVGLLMPPSAEGALANAALAAAGRVAVNFDATWDSASTARAAKTAGVSTFVTTRTFLASMIKRGWRMPPASEIVFIEDFRRTADPVRLRAVAAGLLYLPETLAAGMFLPDAARDLDDTAAIVFTSGSGGEPEAAEFSHLNVLASVEMAREVMPPSVNETLLGVQPLSTIFGYASTIWLPLASGMTAVYHDRPMDSEGVAQLAARHGATVLFGTPTLLRRYARQLPEGALPELRLVVSSGEKMHRSVADEFHQKFKVRPVEVYGGTELTSGATISMPDPRRPNDLVPETVGRVLPGAMARIVDLRTGEEAQVGKIGLLKMAGPNVMKGYVGKPADQQPVKDGWYTTSDLAYEDAAGRITIVGPRARFSQIGGNIVSHSGAEEVFRSITGGDVRVTAVKDAAGKTRLVALYAKWSGDVEALRREAADRGLVSAWIPDAADFHAVERIPLLASGKLDLRRLNDLARSLTK